MAENNINLNLYDLNKSLVNQLKPLTADEINKKISLIEELHSRKMNDHYMLLNKETGYYTIFESDPKLSFPTFGSIVLEIITSLGDIMSIESTEDKNALEIWCRPDGEEMPLAYYLFPYDAGVVYYG